MRSSLLAKARRGATPIELMVALSIMLLIAGGISQLLFRSWLSEETVNDQNQAQKTAQLAVDAIADRLRAASAVTSGDTDQVTVTFENGDTLHYWLEGNALRRSRVIAATGATVSETVIPGFLTTVTFQYQEQFGAGWRVPATAAVADWVVVSVTAGSGRSSVTQASMVKLRNKR